MTSKDNILLSGWATKDFSLEELKGYLEKFNPKIIEISKDFVEGDVSIKKTQKVIKGYKKENFAKISYAGTTDFANCSGMNFNDYLNYLKIQGSQANFLGCDFFRVLISGDPKSEINIIGRLNQFQEILGKCKILIEIHGGWEGNIKNTKNIIGNTGYNFVIDFQNVLESGLNYEKLSKILPKDRVEYYHDRNLKDYLEHKNSKIEKEKWGPEEDLLLWEPKKIQKNKILEFVK